MVGDSTNWRWCVTKTFILIPPFPQGKRFIGILVSSSKYALINYSNNVNFQTFLKKKLDLDLSLMAGSFKR